MAWLFGLFFSFYKNMPSRAGMGLRNDETEGWGREEMPSAHLPLVLFLGKKIKERREVFLFFFLPMGNRDPATSCF